MFDAAFNSTTKKFMAGTIKGFNMTTYTQTAGMITTMESTYSKESYSYSQQKKNNLTKTDHVVATVQVALVSTKDTIANVALTAWNPTYTSKAVDSYTLYQDAPGYYYDLSTAAKTITVEGVALTYTLTLPR